MIDISQCDILCLQEPMKNVETRTLNSDRTALEKHGIQLHEFNHQFILVRDDLLGGRFNLVANKFEGRLVYFTLASNHTTGEQHMLRFISAYGVVAGHNSERYQGTGITRLDLRAAVRDCAASMIDKVTASNQPVVIPGDLQDIISKSDRDNAGNTRIATSRDGLLSLALDNGFTSMVRDRSDSYHTRFAYDNSAARGIDHIMGNSRADDLYAGGEVDRAASSNAYPSTDHTLISCDLTFSTNPHNTMDESHTSTIKYQYGMISRIRVVKNKNSEEEHGFDTSRYMGALEEESKELWDSLQVIAGPASQIHREFVQPALDALQVVEQDLIQKQKELYARNSPKLITRDIGTRDSITKAFTLLKEGTREIMRHGKCVTTTDQEAARQSRRENLLQSNGLEKMATKAADICLRDSKLEIQQARNKLTCLKNALARLTRDKIDPKKKGFRQCVTVIIETIRQLLSMRKSNWVGLKVNVARSKAISDMNERLGRQDAIVNHRPLDKGDTNRTQFENSISSLVERNLTNLDAALSTCGSRWNLSKELDKRQHLMDPQEKSDEEAWLHIPSEAQIKDTIFSEGTLHWHLLAVDSQFIKQVEEPLASIDALDRSISKLWSAYHRHTMEHAAATGHTSLLSRLDLPKKIKLPEPQNILTDKLTGNKRYATSNQERMEATKEKEDKLMKDATTDTHLPYITMTHDDLGTCGATINTNIVVTEEMGRSTIGNFDKLTAQEQEHALDGLEFMKEIMKPAETQAGLDWPFKYDTDGTPNQASGCRESLREKHHLDTGKSTSRRVHTIGSRETTQHLENDRISRDQANVYISDHREGLQNLHTTTNPKTEQAK